MTEPVKEVAALALAAVMAAAIATGLSVMVLWAFTVIGRLSEAILMVMGVM